MENKDVCFGSFFFYSLGVEAYQDVLNFVHQLLMLLNRINLFDILYKNIQKPPFGLKSSGLPQPWGSG